jgi:GNAT superfamily N-acetyltransferase
LTADAAPRIVVHLSFARNAIFYGLAMERDFESIHRLNYRAFVEEIPQHPPNAERRLVDRFHTQNVYVVAREKTPGSDQDTLIGMVGLRGDRPFSLDTKLANLDALLPAVARVCELRLLYVVPEARRSAVFYGLSRALFAAAIARRFELAIVSATLREARLYRHLGFTAFGPEVGTDAARYQPMWLNLAHLTAAVPHLVSPSNRRDVDPISNTTPP